MATETGLLHVLTSFTTATEAATQALPEASSILPPENGITLLDTKSEIFLSYLQALALRNLNVIRSIKEGGDVQEAQDLSQDITKKLVEHRVYLERGVRPLERKIKYEVDKVVKAADDNERAAAQKAKMVATQNDRRGKATGGESDEEDDDSSDSEPEGDIGETSYQPRLTPYKRATAEDANATRRAKSKEDGVYRPPRISATAMPITEARSKKAPRAGRSATVDEYINTEMSTAPLAEPSIGSTITAGGRRNKDNRELKKEAERREYEEVNLVRLPKESNKDKGRKGRREMGGGYGGEEWRGLGESVDRIGDMTRRKGKENALDRSRKRRAVEDGPRNSGIGEAFDVKRQRLMKKGR